MTMTRGMATRGMGFGLLIWAFALFIFFVPMGGMGLFSYSSTEAPVKRAAAEAEPADPVSEKLWSEFDQQVEAQRANAEFRRWAEQSQPSSGTRPSAPRGTPPRPMTNLNRY